MFWFRPYAVLTADRYLAITKFKFVEKVKKVAKDRKETSNYAIEGGEISVSNKAMLARIYLLCNGLTYRKLWPYH